MDSLSGEYITVRLRLDRESLKQPALSPDGRTVYFVHADADSKNEVIRARNLATGQEQVVCRPPSWPYGLAISPDGRQLALYEGWERNSSLSIAPIATGQLGTLFSSPQGIKTIAWTPDGRHLLYSLTQPAAGAGTTATTDLWRIPVEGGQPQKLELAMDSLVDLRMHPDGRHIAFVAGTHKGEVWVMENFLRGEK
jgi:Tol biopolymer transport system component